jgi:type II secretory pathway pseudopilin PulG
MKNILKNNKFSIINKDFQSGQVLLISLLVMIVVLTVGLSVAVRTITTTRMTTAEDSSQRAFSAAEAGIERALTAGAGQTITGDFTASNNSKYEAKTTPLSVDAGGGILVDNGAFIPKDEPVDVWLSKYPDYSSPWAGSLTIYWVSSLDSYPDNCSTKAENSNPPALEVVLIGGPEAAPVVSHYAYDPCAVRRGGNKFTSPTSGVFNVAGKTFANSATIPVTSGLLARVIPLYAGTHIGVSGAGLPSQGTVITSVGNSGGTQRKIVTFRGYPKPPIELYPFLIFSPCPATGCI